MREWLANNYTWVFSGAGVTAIVALIGVFRWKRKSGRGGYAPVVLSQIGRDSIASPVAGRDVHQTFNYAHPPQEKAAEGLSEFNETPSADELDRHVGSVPLLQQNAVRKGFVGLKVKWPVTVRSLWHQAENQVQATLAFGDERYAGGLDIRVDLGLRQYTRLRTIVGGELATIWGTIVRMDAVEIELKVHRLVFDRAPLKPAPQEQ